MSEPSPGAKIFVVDDDPDILQAMRFLLESVGRTCETYASGDEFLDRADLDNPGCLISDIRMPGIGGLQLHKALQERGCTLPVIFLSGHGDVPMAVQAMRQGAVDFLQKPFREQELLDKIDVALQINSDARTERAEQDDVEARLDSLTKREREVFELVALGQPNKVIAQDLGLSQRTVEIHRARVMEKMQARNLAELVRLHLSI